MEIVATLADALFKSGVFAGLVFDGEGNDHAMKFLQLVHQAHTALLLVGCVENGEVCLEKFKKEASRIPDYSRTD